MNKRGLLGVAIRVLGVWVLLWLTFGVLAVGAALRCSGGGPTSGWRGVILVAIIVVPLEAGVGLLLLMKADWLSARLVRQRDVEAGDRPDRLRRRLFSVIMRLVGLLYLLKVLPNVIQCMPKSSVWFTFHADGFSWQGFVAGIIGIALTAYLLLGGRLPERLAFRGVERGASHETQ